MSSTSPLTVTMTTYYHSHTFEPIQPGEEDDTDSDDERLDWLNQVIRLRLEKVVGLRTEDKDLMELWNRFVLDMEHKRTPIRGKKQVLIACYNFIKQFGPLLLARGLYPQCINHFATLESCGLISSDEVEELGLKLLRTKPMSMPTVKPMSSGMALEKSTKAAGDNKSKAGPSKMAVAIVAKPPNNGYKGRYLKPPKAKKPKLG